MTTDPKLETTMKAATKKDQLVQLTSGERIAYGETLNEGVETDAGIVGWDEVEGFWNFHEDSGRWLFVPSY